MDTEAARKLAQAAERTRALRAAAVAENAPEKVQARRAEVEANKKKLISDVKKTTGFVKKVKTISEDSGEQLAADATKLNLRRYVSEIVSNLMDASIKSKDVTGVIRLVNVMHQRYDEFSDPFCQAINDEFDKIEASLDPKDVARRRVLLRIAGELVLCGVVDSVAFLVKILRRMCQVPVRAKDETSDLAKNPLGDLALTNLTGINGLLRVAGLELVGCVPRCLQDQRAALLAEDFPCVPAETRARCQQMIAVYRASLLVRLHKEQIALQKREKSNKDRALNHGTLDEGVAKAFEERRADVDRMEEGAATLCDLTDADPPEPPPPLDEGEPEKATEVAVWARKRGLSGEMEGLSPDAIAYGSEETRAFYQDLPDLIDTLPGALFASTSSALLSKSANALVAGHREAVQHAHATNAAAKASKAAAAQSAHSASGVSTKGTLDGALSQLSISAKPPRPGASLTSSSSAKPGAEGEAAGDQVVDADAGYNDLEYLEHNGDDDSDDDDDFDDADDDDSDGDADRGADGKNQGSRTAVQTEALRSRLQSCLTRSATESFAVDFCHMHTKNLLKRLIKELKRAPWSRLELLPYYARIAAILSPIFPRIGQELMAHLEGEFKALCRFDDPRRLESRLRNARYIGELVKFGHVEELRAGPEKAYFVWTNCFREFRGQNVNCACALFETAGRYLFRNESTHKETTRYLQQLVALSKSQPLNAAEKSLVENAFYYIVPPASSQLRKTRERSDEERFIRYLLFEFLGSELDKNHFAGRAQQGERYRPPRKSLKTRRREQTAFVVKMLKKLDWSEDGRPGTVRLIARCVLAVSKKRALVLDEVCDCLALLSSSYPEAGIYLADLTLERLERVLETNDRRNYQKTIGYARLLAELFNYRIVDINSLFDTLYLVLHHGHALPWDRELLGEDSAEVRARRPRGPWPGGCVEADAPEFHPRVPYAADPPFEAFRLRLACHLLTYARDFLTLPVFAHRLSLYWLYLERYRLAKEYVPMEIDFTVDDVYEALSRPVAERPLSLAEVEQRLAPMQVVAKEEMAKRQALARPEEEAYEFKDEGEEDAVEEDDEEDDDEEDDESDEEEEDDEDSDEEASEEDEAGVFDEHGGAQAIDDDDDDEDDEDDEDEDDEDDEDEDESDEDSDEDDDSDEDEEASDEDFSSDMSDDDDVHFRTAEDEEFEQEYALLMQETMKNASRAASRRKVDPDRMSIPVNLLSGLGVNKDAPKPPSASLASSSSSSSASASSSTTAAEMPSSVQPGVVSLKLLTRSTKGKFEAALPIALPSKSALARSVEKQKQAQEEELQILKQRLVEFESRESESHGASEHDPFGGGGGNLRSGAFGNYRGSRGGRGAGSKDRRGESAYQRVFGDKG